MSLTWPDDAGGAGRRGAARGLERLVKSSGDKELDTALLHFLGAIVALPLLL